MSAKHNKYVEYTEYMRPASEGTLPVDFSRWEIADSEGWTIAHVAATCGHLPADFDQWGLADKHGRSVAHAAARYGRIPVLGSGGLMLLSIADKTGWTVAHEAVRHDHLPANFSQWELADADMHTVAHEATWNGMLPSDFDQWELADKTGCTVAHLAATYGSLPADFDRWGLADNDGVSVLGQLMRPRDAYFWINFMEEWKVEKPLCRAEGDWEVFKKELPEIYRKYAVDESFDDVCFTLGIYLL
jgi:hypothetical protein